MMHKQYWMAAALGLVLLPGIGQAADAVNYLPFETALQEAINAGHIDGSVKFYLGDKKPAGKVSVVKSGVTTSQKSNAFGKSVEASCNRALHSALIRFHKAAKSAGANAVVNLVSNYNHNVYKDNEKYECHKGGVMSGVAIKGDLAKVQ